LKILRSLAFKWIRVMFRCWKERVPHDEVRYLNQFVMRLAECSHPPKA